MKYVAVVLLVAAVFCVVLGWIVSLIASRDNSDMGGIFLVFGMYVGVPLGILGLVVGALWLIVKAV